MLYNGRKYNMQDAILYINEVGKRKNKCKTKKTFPTINRSDIMSGILSEIVNESERTKLSKLYAEIIHMEKNDLKYISEIAISSQNDSDVYEILRRINKTQIEDKEQD